jgi:hypothetical protein
MDFMALRDEKAHCAIGYGEPSIDLLALGFIIAEVFPRRKRVSIVGFSSY